MFIVYAPDCFRSPFIKNTLPAHAAGLPNRNALNHLRRQKLSKKKKLIVLDTLEIYLFWLWRKLFFFHTFFLNMYYDKLRRAAFCVYIKVVKSNNEKQIKSCIWCCCCCVKIMKNVFRFLPYIFFIYFIHYWVIFQKVKRNIVLFTECSHFDLLLFFFSNSQRRYP